MKIASFFAAGQERYGAWHNNQLIEFSGVGASTGRPDSWPVSAQQLITAGPERWQQAEQMLTDSAGMRSFAADAVQWRAPVLAPTKIVCVAFNNSANTGRILRGPKHPALFTKPASALVGHGGAIECRAEYGRVHPEPELAAVIGRRAKNLLPEQAYEHVFGYTIHNDITSPSMRDEDTFQYRAIHPKGEGGHREIEYVESWVSYPGRYKGCDTFACLGPWIVTRDEIPDPHTLAVTCHHKGELVTEDNTENFYFKLPQLLAFITRHMTLEPGDIVSMGTALKKSSQGGAVQNVDLNRFGGPVSVSIEKIGTLINTVTHLE